MKVILMNIHQPKPELPVFSYEIQLYDSPAQIGAVSSHEKWQTSRDDADKTVQKMIEGLTNKVTAVPTKPPTFIEQAKALMRVHSEDTNPDFEPIIYVEKRAYSRVDWFAEVWWVNQVQNSKVGYPVTVRRYLMGDPKREKPKVQITAPGGSFISQFGLKEYVTLLEVSYFLAGLGD